MVWFPSSDTTISKSIQTAHSFVLVEDTAPLLHTPNSSRAVTSIPACWPLHLHANRQCESDSADDDSLVERDIHLGTKPFRTGNLLVQLLSTPTTTPPPLPNRSRPTHRVPLEWHQSGVLPRTQVTLKFIARTHHVFSRHHSAFQSQYSELSDDEEETEVLQAFLEPLEEVKDLTRELRCLRKVNRESRYEGESLFDGCLRLNQTEQGDTSDLCLPITLPWKDTGSFFCFVGLDEFDLEYLEEASRVFISQIFSTVRLLGFGVDRALNDGITTHYDDYNAFAEFILLFSEIHHVALVSDRLMSEADLEYINDDIRSSFTLSCWDDWVGRVHEDVIGSHCHEPKIVTKDEHLEALESFVGSMLYYGDTYSESASELWNIGYGMIFRAKEDFGYLLLDDWTMGELLGEDMLSDTFSDEMPSLLSEGGEDD